MIRFLPPPLGSLSAAKWLPASFVSCLLCTSAGPVAAQSLVPNGSFEDVAKCPLGIGGIALARGWETFMESPDLFRQCSQPTSVGVPANCMGRLEALDGQTYAGLSLFRKQTKPGSDAKLDHSRQENIHTTLVTPTQKGAAYEITLGYALADSSDYYAPTLTLTLSNSIMGVYAEDKVVQTVLLPLGTPLSKQWGVATATFTATRKWEYATIGYSRRVFGLPEYKRALRRNRTHVPPRHCNGNKTCYCYLDKVSLIPLAK